MKEELTAIGLDEPFQFACHPGVPCFNECCQDLNQFLTPYDILRLKQNLSLTSTVFLEKWTLQHVGPETGLPVITLKPTRSSGGTCPFVTDVGCRVYNDRPGSCRMYPLARMISRSRENGAITEHYAVIREAHCRGFDQDGRQTVREWVAGQELTVYNEMNDLMMELISLKNQLKPGPMAIKDAQLFHLACYDIDRFRTAIFEKGLLGDALLPNALLDELRTDDGVLLRFGLQWVYEKLFGPQ